MSVHVVPLLELVAADGADVGGVDGPAVDVPLAMLVEVGDLRVSLAAAWLGASERTLARVQAHVVVQVRHL